ncbi:hypothetical protein [Rudanella paleaurantiibacter]|nr:hypothetical protein [Rudanella paleaurantiibacter]
MTFFERLFRFGRSTPVPEAPPAPEAGQASVPMVAPPTPLPPVAALPVVPQAAPDWLTDERLLRDEGVIFGLSEARPEEKTAVIRTFFAHQTAGLERQIEQYNEKIGELNLFIGQRENSLAELEHRHTTLLNQPPANHQLPRTVVGLLLACAMCVGNYFLIETALQPAYPTHTTFIAGGVFLAGMFGLFSRTSLFHDPDSRLSVRRVLEEIALPVVSAGFVWMMALQSQSAPMAAALGLFVLGLFLFGGKLLLGLLTVLRDDLRAYSANRQLLQDQRAFTARYETETKALRHEMDQLRAQKWQILPDLTRTEAERDRLNARRDMLVRLFESEFNLARSVKDRLSDAQRRAILGES